jgi:hypothetical protein
MVTTATRHETDARDTWADLNGRWFFAWRMATACEDALQEVRLVMARQHPPDRAQALENISRLLQRELRQWVWRGEALDMIVERLPRPAN